MGDADTRERGCNSDPEEHRLALALMESAGCVQLGRVDDLASVVKDHRHLHEGLVDGDLERAKGPQQLFDRLARQLDMAHESGRRIQAMEQLKGFVLRRGTQR